MKSEYEQLGVGERIKSIRKNRKMTQAYLAEMAELDETFISRIETGRAASLISLIKIASVLNTSLDYIVFGEERQK